MLKKLGALGVSILPLSAFAAVPADVTTAITDMKADSLTVAVGFLVAVISLRAIHLMRRA